MERMRKHCRLMGLVFPGTRTQPCTEVRGPLDWPPVLQLCGVCVSDWGLRSPCCQAGRAGHTGPGPSLIPRGLPVLLLRSSCVSTPCPPLGSLLAHPAPTACLYLCLRFSPVESPKCYFAPSCFFPYHCHARWQGGTSLPFLLRKAGSSAVCSGWLCSQGPGLPGLAQTSRSPQPVPMRTQTLRDASGSS